MLPGEHHIDQDPKGVNISPAVGLGQTVLLRSASRWSQHLGIHPVVRFV